MHKSLEKNLNFIVIESLKIIGFTSFEYLTILNVNKNCEKLYAIATGPKRSLSLIEVDLQNYEVKNN